MPDQKLTADQIAGFEARAAAGERPALEWRDGHIGDAFPMITIHTVDQMPGTNAWTIRPRAEHYVRIATKTAAQLAAEHLLREATAPLHKGQ